MELKVVQDIITLLSYAEVREGKTDYIEDIREKALDLSSHFDSDYPEHLLHVQHPGEMIEARAYRIARWQGVTLTATGRVFTSLQKIQQADDFRISFNNELKATGLSEENSLETYLTDKLPKFRSLETWLFQPFLREYLRDSNAVVFVGPDLMPWIDSFGQLQPDFTKPYPQIFCSEDIVHKTDGGLIVKLDKVKIKDRKWDRFLAITETGIVFLLQNKEYKDGENAFQEFVIDYQFKQYPIYNIGNVIDEIEEGNVIFDSIIAPCLPAWNEALFRNDDLTVNWGLHGNPQFWQLKTTPCKTCRGEGYLAGKNGELRAGGVCGTCNGNGTAAGSPFEKIEVNLQKSNVLNPGTPSVPTPPAGYITRDTESLKAQIEDIERQLIRGFQAIGLELLANIPVAQSGIAKQYDRKEINTFFYQVAKHLARIYYEVAKAIYLQRYSALLGTTLNNEPIINTDKIEAAMPQIRIPTDFDVLTQSVIAESLKMAIDSNFGPVIEGAIKTDYIVKLYGEGSYQAKLNNALTNYDPLPNRTEDEKLVIKESGGCSELDYILSTYLTSFVTQLIEGNPKWLDEKPDVKRAMLNKMALEKQTEIRSGLVELMPDDTDLRVVA